MLETAVIYWSVHDIVGFVLVGLIFIPIISYWIIQKLQDIYRHMFVLKAYARTGCDYKNMMLDRKWYVECKRHFWNRYKKYDGNFYTKYEADNIVREIETGTVKI